MRKTEKTKYGIAILIDRISTYHYNKSCFICKRKSKHFLRYIEDNKSIHKYICSQHYYIFKVLIKLTKEIVREHMES